MGRLDRKQLVQLEPCTAVTSNLAMDLVVDSVRYFLYSDLFFRLAEIDRVHV